VMPLLVDTGHSPNLSERDPFNDEDRSAVVTLDNTEKWDWHGSVLKTN